MRLRFASTILQTKILEVNKKLDQVKKLSFLFRAVKIGVKVHTQKYLFTFVLYLKHIPNKHRFRIIFKTYPE
jgi:hypothetical protein